MTQLTLPGFAPPPTLASLIRRFDHPMHALAAYPEVEPAIRSQFAKQIGRSGEFLVDSVTHRYGLRSLPSFEDEPFDRHLIITPRVFDRMQIKTQTAPNAMGNYVFTFAKGYSRSGQGRRPYEAGDYDIKVCVILPLNAVYFTREQGHSVTITPLLLRHILDFPQESLFAALRPHMMDVTPS
ncbi:MAG: hypothetical protein RSE12_08605 [Fuscovulum sp.]|nr:MAG: hypothetical protein RSE12_08605 [Fuscovulum sp.]